MSKQQLFNPDQIQNLIYTIRGEQVMLDSHLANLYEIKPIRLREQVKRNKKRFPIDFMFQLNENEVEFMVSQKAIPSKQHLGGHLPFVFTEQGVANLASIITSGKAIEINIQIMRTFVIMRRFIGSNAQLFQRIDRIELKQLQDKSEIDQNFNKLFDALEAKDISPKQGIIFEGQIFDAHAFVSKIIRSAKKNIIIIDNYIDDSVLTLLTKRKKAVKLKIFTKTITKVLAQDIKKFKAQYGNIECKELKNTHDRFIIIDEKYIYHSGASLKDLGKKMSAFSKFDKTGLELLGKLK